MFFSKKSSFTNFSEFRAEYCKFMIICTRNNIHIKVMMTIFCLVLGLCMAYWTFGMDNEFERNLKHSSQATQDQQEFQINVLE